MYTKEEEAIRFIVKAFENKKRQKEDINSSFHSIGVGFMLKSIGCDEETVLTGLLHDVIEDTQYDYNYIKENYGKKVADNVLSISEDESIINLADRETKFIDNLNNVNDNIVLVEIADKLHNLLSDYEIWKAKGKEAFYTANSSYEVAKRKYLKYQELFNTRISNNQLLDRFNYLVNLYFGGDDNGR